MGESGDLAVRSYDRSDETAATSWPGLLSFEEIYHRTSWTSTKEKNVPSQSHHIQTFIVDGVDGEMADQESNLRVSPLYPYRFHILCSTWLFLTGVAFFRVSRQPYNSRVKPEQYETIFKATTLAAVIGGIGVNGGLNKPHSQAVKEEKHQQKR